jgi:hypothetical protein
MMAPKRKRQLLDKFISKLVSRKLLAWFVSTILCVVGMIVASPVVAVAVIGAWEMITIVYIGTQGAVDTAIRWRMAGAQQGFEETPDDDVVDEYIDSSEGELP